MNSLWNERSRWRNSRWAARAKERAAPAAPEREGEQIQRTKVLMKPPSSKTKKRQPPKSPSPSIPTSSIAPSAWNPWSHPSFRWAPLPTFFFFSISSKSPFYLLLPLLLIVTTVIFNWFREIGTVDFLGQGSLDWMRSSGVVFIIWWPINSMVLIVETTQKPGIVSGEFWSVFQLYEWISIVAA